MNRKEKIQFINENILSQLNVLCKGAGREAYRLLCNWREGKRIDVEMHAVVDDGFLFINGEPVGRIAPKAPKVHISEKACYWEGRILSRQEEE